MTESAAQLPASTRLGRTALRVSDMAKVGAFYGDVVGLEVLDRDDAAATMGVDGTPLLELYEDDTIESRDVNEAGLFHNAFKVPSREALGDALQRIDINWQLDGASDHEVSEALYLSDPEDNGVEIYRDRPRDTWPIDEDGHVQMDTLPLDVDAVREAGNGEKTAPPETAVGHVHLEVSSLPRAREFYQDVLGLSLRQVFDEMAVFLAADDYHHHVGLNTWHERSKPVGGRGIAWFELVVPETATLEQIRERVAEAEYAVREVDGGIEISDPDGIGVRVRSER